MRIGKLFGIDIIIHVSWIFIFALVAWSLASDLGPLQHVEASQPQRIILAIGAALLFFASVLAHELAHSLVALSRGIRVSRITLFIFGGVSSLESDASTAGSEGWIAFVGPLTSLVLGLAFYGIAVAFGSRSPFGGVAAYLGYANIALAIFNLVPAYPLDGGRVLRALLWRGTNDRMRATRIAAATGRAIASVMIGLGILETLVAGFGQGLWIVFIGWFLLQAGGTEVSQLELASKLKEKSAADLAVSVPPPIPANASVRTAAELLLRSGRPIAPVMFGDQFVGVVTLADVERVPDDVVDDTPVTAIMTRAASLTSVRPSAAATDILRMISNSGSAVVPIVDANGTLSGLITREALLYRLSTLT